MFMESDDDDLESRRQQIMAAAHEQRLRHDRFVSDLSKDQLTTFIDILQAFSGETGTNYVHFMMGRAATVMEFKHNSCPGCGEDHFSIASLDGVREDLKREGIIKEPERSADMVEYGMVVKDGQLQCENCGLHSVSMEDRMLRSPKADGCSGCQQKSAFG